MPVGDRILAADLVSPDAGGFPAQDEISGESRQVFVTMATVWCCVLDMYRFGNT
jgi:hypothetical protein